MNSIDQIISRRRRGNRGNAIVIPRYRAKPKSKTSINIRNLKPEHRRTAIGLAMFNLVAVAVAVGFLMTGKAPRVLGAEELTFSMPGTGELQSNFDVAGYDDWEGTTSVSPVEVHISTDPMWWDADWDYKRQLTIKNLSIDELSAGSTAQVTLNTKALNDLGKAKDNCQDVRIVWYDSVAETHTELSRSFYGSTPGGNCSVSTTTAISFALKSTIAASGSDSNYYLYYGNSGASDPGYGDSGYSNPVSGATATLVCPFNGSTTCLGGETPTTETGAIRYSGTKSAMSFDGNNDYAYIADGATTRFYQADNFTVETWVKTADAETLLFFKYAPGAIRTYGLFMSSGRAYFMFQDQSGNQVSCNSGIAINDNVWHHVAGVRDVSADNAYVYIDGIRKNTCNDTTTGDFDRAANINIGANGVWDNYLSGLLDEVRISNTARYTADFTPQTTPFAPDTNTRVLLHFDENGDDPRNTGMSIDASGNSNHATISGAKYVSGLVGVDNTTANTGALPTQTYAGHQGVYLEEGTTNKITNPSFEHATYNTNWMTPYFNYNSSLDTFTAGIAKRNSAGPFAAGPMIQGNWDGTGTANDGLRYSRGTQISGNFYNNADLAQGSIVFWVTPEWNGNDGITHYIWGSPNSEHRIYKHANSSLLFGISNMSTSYAIDASSWTAGTTYCIVVSWDSKNPIYGDSYVRISINDTHAYGWATAFTPTTTSTVYDIGNLNNGYYPGNEIIEGFTMYRRSLWDGAYGIDVGNGDEISQIWEAGAGKDPTLVTGSWDVVFALPTNATAGVLTAPTATGEAWSHPYTSNALYTSITNTGGFMMNGTYTADGWADQGTPTAVGALATAEKIYFGGYKWTNDAANEGIKYTKTGPAGQNYVVRALAHSDITSIPKIQIWDATNGAEITQMTGTLSSLRTAPDMFLFTFELPTVARNGVAADCTSIEVRLLNTQASGTVYWHQVELLVNMIDNPSLETPNPGADPWIPDGWSNSSLVAGDSSRETTTKKSGVAAFRFNTSTLISCGIYETPTLVASVFYSAGMWSYGDGSKSAILNDTNSKMNLQASGGGLLINGPTTTAWGFSPAVARATGTNPTFKIKVYGSATGSIYVDDVYLFALSAVSLYVTPASEANSLETTGLRVDGRDSLSQPVTGLSTTSGVIRFKYTPRHSFADASKFGFTQPHLAYFAGNGTNSIMLDKATETQIYLIGHFNGTYVMAIWTNPVFNAGTTYAIDISYITNGNLMLTVDGVQKASAPMGANLFTTVPTTAYFGCDSNSNRHYDGTISNFTSSTPTENTTNPYYKFGSKSTRLDLSTGTLPDQYVTSINAGNINVHMLSAYVYNGTSGSVGGTVDGTVAKLIFNGVAQTTTYTDMGGGWWRLTYTAAAGSGAQNYGVQVMAGKIVYLDGVQLEEKGYATTYTDGTLGTSYAWSGTAHNSTSTRTAGVLKYSPTNNISPTAGSISLWFKTDWNSNDGQYHYILDSRVGGAQNRIAILKDTSDLTFSVYGDTSGGYTIIRKTSPSISIGQWRHLVVTWDSTGAKTMYLDNVSAGTVQIFGSWVTPTTFGTTVDIGNAVSSSLFDGVLSDLRFYDKPITAAEITDLYYQGLATHQDAEEDAGKYLASGTYTTPILDLGAVSDWSATDDFTTTEFLNDGTITYQTSTSEDSITWDPWQDLVGAEIQSDPNRYVKVKAAFTSSLDKSNTPVLSGLNINYIPDNTPPNNPTVLLTSPGESGNWFNDSTPSFSWPRADQIGGATDPGEGASGVRRYHVYFGTDPNAIPFLTVSNKWVIDNPETGDVEFTLPVELTEKGTYYLRIQTEDNAGNYQGNNPEDAWMPFTYKYEAVNPTRPLYISVNPSGYTRVNEYTFSWPAGEDTDSGVWGYCYHAGDAEETCETKEALTVGDHYEKYLVDIAYQNGGNVFYVRTLDNAGNYSSNTQATFYFNSDAPSAPLSVVAHQGTGCSGGDDNCWYFTWEPPLEYTEEIVRYYYSINETPTGESTYVAGTSTQTDTFAAGTRQGENTFYVVAEDVVGVSFGDYGSATFSVNTTAPGIPTSIFITDASNRDTSEWALTVKWSAPTSTGSGIDHYNIYRSTNGVDYSKVGTASTPIYSEGELSQSHTYYYRVSAEDNAGAESGLSTAVSAIPTGKYTSPPLFGGTPTTTTTAHTAVIQWTTDRLTEGFVEYGRTTEYELGRIGDNSLTTAHRVTIRGLSSETSFHYRVQSLDDGAVRTYDPASAYSEDYTFATMKAPDITEVTVSDVTLSSANISWKTTTISTSEIHYGSSINYGSVVSEQSSSLTTNHTLRLTSLNSGTTYQFKIIGKDADDVEISSDNYMFSTIAYPRITNLRLEKGEVEGEYGMHVSWESNVPITSVARYYPPDNPSGGRDETIADLNTSHTLFVSGLLDNTLYYIVAQGRDAYGNLAVSETLQFTTDIDTRPPIISKLTVETASQATGKDAKAQIIVSWETNEPATSQVEYGIGVGGESYSNKSPEDSSLNKTHVVVLSDLNSGTPYSVRVISNDAVGNSTVSGNYTVVTSMPTASALDLILSTLRDNFGWLFDF